MGLALVHFQKYMLLRTFVHSNDFSFKYPKCDTDCKMSHSGLVWTHPRQLCGGGKERGEGESPIELRRAATLTVLAARAAAAIGPRGDRRRAADFDGETAKCDFESPQISRHHRRFQDRTRTLIRIPV